jgi:hypothetical protein
MPSLADAFRELSALRESRVIEDYAVGGAMAMLFWAEPVLTFDLDVFVILPAADSRVTSLAPLYEWLRSRGHVESAEHVMIHGTPVQFLVSPNPLSDEAIADAARLELEGVPVRVMRPEHLCALWLQAGGAKRRERVRVLQEAGVVDEAVLTAVLLRHGIQGLP